MNSRLLNLLLALSAGLFVPSMTLAIDSMSPPSETEDQRILTQSGKLFTVQLVPADRKLTVRVVGYKTAEVAPTHLELFGQMIPREGSPKSLRIVGSKQGYQIDDALKSPGVLELRVRNKTESKEEETFRFNLNQN